MADTSSSNGLAARAFFRIRHRWANGSIARLRALYFRLLGMTIGKGTGLPKIFVTWPHQVFIGEQCRLEHHIYFHFDGIYSEGPSIKIGSHCFIGTSCEFNIRKGITIGDGSMIAAGARFVDHDHGLDNSGGFCPAPEPEQAITIGERVWIGANAIILKEVQIADSAIVAAGAVVTKDVAAGSIVAGVPAQVIAERANKLSPR